MINGVGKTGQAALQPSALSADRAAAAGKVSAPSVDRNAPGAASISGDLARMGAPVDSDKVAAIRAAIAEGRYPVDPDRIAAAMVALDLPVGR